MELQRVRNKTKANFDGEGGITGSSHVPQKNNNRGRKNGINNESTAENEQSSCQELNNIIQQKIDLLNGESQVKIDDSMKNIDIERDMSEKVHVLEKNNHRNKAQKNESDGKIMPSVKKAIKKIDSDNEQSEITYLSRCYDEQMNQAINSQHISQDNKIYLNTIVPRLNEAKTKILKIKESNKDLWNKIKESIQNFMKEQTKFTWKCVTTGSYYDNTQVSQAVEFDVIMCISNRAIKVSYFPYTENQNSSLCCLLKPDSTKMPEIEYFLGERKLVTERKTYLSPKMFYSYFEQLVKEYLENCIFKSKYDLKILKNKEGCPAVTLGATTKRGTISMDIVPAIELHEWPPPARDWSCHWIPEKYIKALKGQSDSPIEYEKCNRYYNKHIYAVPKIHYCERFLSPGECIHFQLSFGQIEKTILRNTNSTETCIKHIYKLLKQDLNEFYKDENNDEIIICSFHIKHMLFSLRSETEENAWKNLGHQVVEQYRECLKKLIESIETETIPFFFLPEVNLFEDKLHDEPCDDGTLFIPTEDYLD